MTRSSMYESVDEMLTFARKLRDQREGKRVSRPDDPVIANVREWPPEMRYQQEMEVAGIFTTGHPLNDYAPFVEHLDGADFEKKGDHYQIRCGTVTSVKERQTKNGNPMWWVTYLTRDGSCEEPIFEWRYDRFGAFIEEGKTLAFVRKEGTGQYKGSYNIEACYPIGRAMEEWAQVANVEPDDPACPMQDINQDINIGAFPRRQM